MNLAEYRRQLQERRDAAPPLTVITVRLPIVLADELKSLAEYESKSLNRLCVETLKGAVDGARIPGGKGWEP